MAQFIFEPIVFFLAFEWDLRDIDGSTHFLDKKTSGIIYIYTIYTIQTCVIYSKNKQK